MKKLFLPLAAVGLAISLPALAQETTISYTGTIAATPDPTQAFGLKPGDPVYFSVTYDSAMLIDRTSTGVFHDANTGQQVNLQNIFTVSLADDPNSAFSETIGSHTFTRDDDLRFGEDEGTHAGNFPTAIFQGSTFVGVSFFAQAPDGLVTLQDPISVALNYLPTYGIGGDNNSDNPAYGFLITTDLPPIQLPAAAAVPEAATWTMMILGFGAVGYAVRRRNRMRRGLSSGARSQGGDDPMLLFKRSSQLRLGTAMRCLAVTALATAAMPAAHATDFTETADFRDTPSNPTLLGELTPGSNLITGVINTFGDRVGAHGERAHQDMDYVTFIVPAGYALTNFVVSSSTSILTADPAVPGSRDDLLFLGLAAGDQVNVSQSFDSAAGLLGWALVSQAQLGDDILSVIGSPILPNGTPRYANFPVPGATTFSGSLGAGTYSLWLYDGDEHANYSFNLVTTAVPEPAAWMLMIAGMGVVGTVLRRKARWLGAFPA